MVFSSFLLFLLLVKNVNVVFAQFRTPGAILEVDFVLEDCLSSSQRFTPVIDTLGAGDFRSTQIFSNSVDCPSINTKGVFFPEAFNGITTSGGDLEGVVSDFNIVNDVLEFVEQTWEFWVFIPNNYNPTKEEILLEVSIVPEIFISWEQGSAFFVQITLQNDRLTFRGSQAGDETVLLSSVGFQNAIESTPDGGLVHLTVVRNRVGGFVVTTLFINGQNEASVTASGSPEIFLPEADIKLFLGGSHGLQTVELDVTPLTAVLQKVAIYDFALVESQVQGNFNAGVQNSPPAVTAASIDHFEDTITSFTFSDFVFDFDRDIIGLDDDIVVQIVEAPNGDKGSLDVQEVVDIDIDQVVNYTQTVENDDQGEDTFTFKAIQSFPQLESVTRTFELEFQESNDPPSAGFFTDRVAELQTLQTQLIATDENDTGNGRVRTDFHPILFTLSAPPIITSISVGGESIPVARVFRCSDGQDLVQGDEFDAQTNDEINFFTDDVCVTAKAFDNQPNALIGEVALTFDVIDGEGLIGFFGITAVQVVQALSAGCIFIDPENCETEIIEEVEVVGSEESAVDGVTIELQLFDSRCDGLNIEDQDSTCLDVIGCSGACLTQCRLDINTCPARIKQGVIVEPLPDPLLEGSLFFITESGVEQEITSELLEDNDGAFVLPILLGLDPAIADMNNKLVFRAVEGYFNLAPFPICINERNQDESRAQCLDIVNGQNVQTCFGSFCDIETPSDDINTGFTTGVELFNNFEPFGFCGTEAQIDNGCPVRINYQTKVGNTVSLEENNQEPTHVVWVQNVNSGRATINLQDEYEFLADTPLSFVPPITVLSPEGNSQALRVAFEVNNGGILRISDFSSFNDEASSLTFLDIDSGFGSGITNESSVDPSLDLRGYIIGFGDRINAFLEGMTVEVSQDSVLTVSIQSPFELNRLRNQVTFQVNLKVISNDGDNDDNDDNNDDDENDSVVDNALIIGVAGVGGCCCLIVLIGLVLVFVILGTKKRSNANGVALEQNAKEALEKEEEMIAAL